jgi:hypothetical protein
MSNPSSQELQQVRLLSSEMVHTPGLLAWAVIGYRFPRDRPALRRVIGDTYRLTRRCVDDLLSGRVAYTVEGDAVVFQYPAGFAKRPE